MSRHVASVTTLCLMQRRDEESVYTNHSTDLQSLQCRCHCFLQVKQNVHFREAINCSMQNLKELHYYKHTHTCVLMIIILFDHYCIQHNGRLIHSAVQTFGHKEVIYN